MPISLVVHGHFYQPPRENPWTDCIEREPTAAPFHDWNARIHAECYRANAFARIHDRTGRIQAIVNNYSRMSFNFGPTLARWIESNDATVHARLVAADQTQRDRLGMGGAMAQAYAHPILPLCSARDRRTQISWGLADFRRRFGRDAEGLWMPETAANADTLEALIELGVKYTIVAPEQVAAVRAPGTEPTADWTSVDRDTVDTGRAYRWFHRDGSGRFLTIAVFDGPLSRGVAFGDATRDSASFISFVKTSAARSHIAGGPLVLCASDGELFGHHKKFADLNLAFTSFVEGPRQGLEAGNLGAYLRTHPATWEMELAQGPDGKGTSWSCAHGVGRWWKDCGCSMVAPERGWNQRWRTPLRQALDLLQSAAASHFESAGSRLFRDPWAARDGYGDVLDASLAIRDARLSTYGTAALLAGGEMARNQARLLIEMQRSALLMFASCGWYFDDIAGLETSLVLRLAAHTADLLSEAGGAVPLADMLDVLAGAKSNESVAVTGADVFRKMAGDRVTPAHAVATVALALAASEVPAGTGPLAPSGFEVEILAGSTHPLPDGSGVAGQARATNTRTGVATSVAFRAGWDPLRGFRVSVDGQPLTVNELGRENRHRLLPRLLPDLLNGRSALQSARLLLELGLDVVGSGSVSGADDLAARDAFAYLVIRLLREEPALSPEIVDTALLLIDAAGMAMGPGSVRRTVAEELLSERLDASAALPTPAVLRLAESLGFAAPPESADADTSGSAMSRATGSATGASATDRT